MIYGNGTSGRSAFAAVTKRGATAQIFSDKPTGEFVMPDGVYDFAVISPGISPTHPVYAYCDDRGINRIGEAELGFMLKTQPAIGITGTNGKTTTVRLTADMTGGVACGNIGYPITTAIDSAGERTLVCELSSFQLAGSTHISPEVAVITNISSDHLNWHGTLDRYYESKCRIAGENTKFLVLSDDIPVKALKALHTNAEIVYCSTERTVDGAYIDDGNFCFFGERICRTDYLRLNGKHNLKNALCAVAASKCMNASDSDIIRALSAAELAPHRLNEIGRVCGKRWIDDSKSTNISSCLAALDTTVGTVCLITGGSDKGLDFSELFGSLDAGVVDVIAMGATAETIKKCGEKSGISVTAVDGLESAVKAASSSRAETVLLSPACASFDEFENYKARGDKFIELVGRLKCGA